MVFCFLLPCAQGSGPFRRLSWGDARDATALVGGPGIDNCKDGWWLMTMKKTMVCTHRDRNDEEIFLRCLVLWSCGFGVFSQCVLLMLFRRMWESSLGSWLGYHPSSFFPRVSLVGSIHVPKTLGFGESWIWIPFCDRGVEERRLCLCVLLFFARLSWVQQDALVAEKVENFVAGKFVCRRPWNPMNWVLPFRSVLQLKKSVKLIIQHIVWCGKSSQHFHSSGVVAPGSLTDDRFGSLFVMWSSPEEFDWQALVSQCYLCGVVVNHCNF